MVLMLSPPRSIAMSSLLSETSAFRERGRSARGDAHAQPRNSTEYYQAGSRCRPLRFVSGSTIDRARPLQVRARPATNPFA